MATYRGLDGSVFAGGGAVGEVSSWTINISAGTVDDTVMGDEWETHKVTTKSWTASVECFFDPDDAQQGAMVEGASLAVELRTEGDTSGDFQFSGTATVESVSVNPAKDNIITASYSLKGNGVLTRGTVA